MTLLPTRSVKVWPVPNLGFTNLDYAAEADDVLRLAKWLQFKDLEHAIGAAVAVNYYTGYDDREIE